MSTDQEPPVARQDLEALLEARRELGPTFEAELVDSFAERVERAVEQRVDTRLADRRYDQGREDEHDARQLALGIVSLGTGIPISAIAVNTAHLPGLVVGWLGIIGVNVAYALRGRRGR